MSVPAPAQETAFVADSEAQVSSRPSQPAESQPSQPDLNSNPNAKSKPPRMLGPDLLRGLLMLLQSIDHCGVGITAWQHGTARLSEMDGQNVTEWNYTLPYILRNCTHLCAPGFMFLLGMGVVYFGNSRSKLGWSKTRLLNHFALRALALFVVDEVAFLWMIPGVWIFNIVLIALAVNYLLAGVIWMAVDASEKLLAEKLEARRANTGENQPLLKATSGSRSSNISWHAHNALLLVLAAITVGWNSWLSPDHGTCSYHDPSLPLQALGTGRVWFDFWFFPIQTTRIISGFPPLAWLAFAILGILYGRIVTRRPWSTTHLIIGNTSAGFVLLVLFVTTRLFRYGNLSENCLHMAEHLAHPDRNQYLTSFRSFLYVTKYPPSFSFLTITLAVNLIILAAFTAIPPKIGSRIPTLLVFGTSALFFYVVHLLYYSILGQFVKAKFGEPQPWRDEMRGGQAFGVKSRWVYWAFWLSGIVVIYPLCRWYGGFKARRGPDSVFRFF